MLLVPNPCLHIIISAAITTIIARHYHHRYKFAVAHGLLLSKEKGKFVVSRKKGRDTFASFLTLDFFMCT
jgi:hypothetical protein